MASPGPVARVGGPAAVVAGLTVLALALRLALMRDSLLGDELIMFDIVHGRGLGDVLHIVRATEKTPPLHFVLAWASARIGDPTLWIRLPSLLAGVGLVPVAYLLGRATVGTRAGLVAAALLALQPFAIFYATEARAYALVALLAGLSTLGLLRALETDRGRWWAAYALAVLAVAFTHYIGVFVLLTQAAWAFWARRDRVRPLVLVHGLIVLAYLPWVPSYLVQQGHSGDEAERIAALAPPSLEYFARANTQVLLGQPFASLDDVPGTAAVVVALAVIVAATALAAARARRGGRPGARGVLVIALAAATPVGIGLLSLPPDHSFLLPRNMSASLPALAVVVGWLLTALRRPLAVAALALFLGALACGTAAALDPDSRRSPFRATAHWIDDRARAGDPVIQHFFLFDAGALGEVLRVNFARPHPLYRGGGAAEAAAWARGRRTGRAFVVLPLPGAFASVEQLDRRAGPGDGFELVAERRFDGLDDILVGEYRARAG
jgi:4-amino-4-deoxy-L-arabinose transferase-like glycosyltransferase